MKVCGVTVTRPQGHSWAPNPTNGSGVNVGTIPTVPSSVSCQLTDGKVCCRLIPTEWGGGVVVVRGRESRLHGEGPQHVRSIQADQGDR